MTIQSSVLAWRIPRTEEPGRLLGSQFPDQGFNCTPDNESISPNHWLLLLLLSHFRDDPIDGSPPGSSVLGILQARTLKWVAISLSNACMHAKSLQSRLSLCNPMDSSLPGSSGHGILQARILQWVAIFFSIELKLEPSNLLDNLLLFTFCEFLGLYL